MLDDGEATEQLRGIAQLLRSSRDVYLAMWHEGLIDDREGSRAHAEFRSSEHGPSGAWPEWLVPQTRAMAVTLVRQQADFCVSTGVLIDAGELFEPIYSLVRSAFEFGLRAFWLLEPDATLRQRCARGRLMELVSLNHVRDASRGRPDAAERRVDRVAAKRNWKVLTAQVESMFEDVQLRDDPKEWWIEGTRYESWTAVAERWLSAGGVAMSGGALYKLLSVRAHPQGLLSTPGFGVGADNQTTRSTSLTELSRLASISAMTFYLSLTLLTGYHGLVSDAVKRLENDLTSKFPTIFR